VLKPIHDKQIWGICNVWEACQDQTVRHWERFFRNLKTERLNHLRFINHEAVIAEIESYIYFYNYKRLNSAIDYLTPNQKFNELRK